MQSAGQPCLVEKQNTCCELGCPPTRTADLRRKGWRFAPCLSSIILSPRNSNVKMSPHGIRDILAYSAFARRASSCAAPAALIFARDMWLGRKRDPKVQPFVPRASVGGYERQNRKAKAARGKIAGGTPAPQKAKSTTKNAHREARANNARNGGHYEGKTNCRCLAAKRRASG